MQGCIPVWLFLLPEGKQDMADNGGVAIDQIKAMLRKDEGLSLKVYKCPAGKKTVGYGHNIEARPLPQYIAFYLSEHGEITLEMAEYLLDMDITLAVEAAKKIIMSPGWMWLTPNRRAVMVMMVFNIGAAGFLNFHGMRAAIAARDVEGVCQHMRSSKWYRQLGGDPIGTDDGKEERPEHLIKMFREG